MAGVCPAYLLAGALLKRTPSIVHNIQLLQTLKLALISCKLIQQARRQEAIIRVAISKDLRDETGIYRFTGRSDNRDSVEVECPDQHQHHADYMQGREGRVDLEALGQPTGRPLAEDDKMRHASQADQMRWALIIGLGRLVAPEAWKTDMASSLVDYQG
jgi:hypothetical protein